MARVCAKAAFGVMSERQGPSDPHLWRGHNATVSLRCVSEARMRSEFMKALEELDAGVGLSLDPRLRAMIRLRTSHINGCSLCVRLYSEDLAALNVRTDVIAALARPVKLMREDLVTEAEAVALRFAEILTDYPRGLELEARDEAARHFTSRQLGAIVEVVSITNAINRVSRGSE